MFTIIILIEINRDDYYESMDFAYSRLPHSEKIRQEK